MAPGTGGRGDFARGQLRSGQFCQGTISPPLKSPKLPVPYAQMTAITQQDTPQTDTPKLQHIATTKRASTSSTSSRISSTRFHKSAQQTVGSGAFVSAWLFLENTIPLHRWRKMELFHRNFAGGKFCHFSTAEFWVNFSLPLYGADPKEPPIPG